MTRHECEAKLLTLAEQMRALYMEYNPAGEHLSVIISGSGYIGISDAFFTEDNKVILDVHDNVFSSVNVSRYSDGHIRYGCPVKDGAA